jgi:hypothetical protein
MALEKQRPALAPARQPRDQAGTAGRTFNDARLEALLPQQPGQILNGRRLVAGRVGGVKAEQGLKA